MKKVLLVLIMIFLMPIVTFASEATCTYKYEGVSLVINYKHGQNLTYNSQDLGNTKFGSIKGIEIKDIVDSNGNISCPILYAKKSVADQKQFKVDFNINKLEGYSKVNNANLNILKKDNMEITNPNSNFHSCIYDEGKDTEYKLTWNGSSVVVTLTGSKYNNFCSTKITQTEWNSTMFENGKCPSGVYDLVNSRYRGEGCRGQLFISTKKILTDDDLTTDLDESENIYSGDSNSSNSSDLNTSEIEECTSLLGHPETEKSPAWFLSIIFSIIRYVAIILLIVLTIIDFVGATASQDNDAIKKVVSKTIKRAIICVVIFVLPTLIDLVLQFIHDSSVSDCIKNI